MKKLNQITFHFVWVTAILALPATFLWLFGAPGVDGDYARGWEVGFLTLIYYIMGCVVTLVAYGLTRLAIRKYPQFSQLKNVITGIFWVFFGYSVFSIFRAFVIMTSAY